MLLQQAMLLLLPLADGAPATPSSLGCTFRQEHLETLLHIWIHSWLLHEVDDEMCQLQGAVRGGAVGGVQRAEKLAAGQAVARGGSDSCAACFHRPSAPAPAAYTQNSGQKLPQASPGQSRR